METEIVRSRTSIFDLDGGAGEAPPEMLGGLEPPSFSSLPRGVGQFTSSFLVSLLLHASVMAALPIVAVFLVPIPELTPVRLLRYEPLRIRMPERVYAATRQLAVPPPPVDPPNTQRRPSAKLEMPPESKTDASLSPETAPAPPEPARRTPRQLIELPAFAPKQKADFTLIQPDFPENRTVNPNTPPPQILAWSAPQARRPLKEFVIPGSPPRKPETPLLDAPPQLALPNHEAPVAALRFAGMPAPAAPALPVRASTTVPLRRFAPPPARSPSQAPALDLLAGEHALVISIPDRPQAVPDLLSIPAGNQAARVQPPARPASDSGSGAGAKASSSEAGKGTSVSVPTGAAGATLAAGYVHPVRIEHPETAVFDIVVVGSAPSIAGAANILSGSPVFTVHVRAGTPRSWVMQYCLPNQKAASKTSGAVVTLGNPSPLRAPYPRIIVAPAAALLADGEPISLHGFIGSTGTFQSLRVLAGQRTAHTANLLELLEAWQFRPAARDGKPVAVEILLNIPAQGKMSR